MACDCLKETTEKLRVHYDDPEGETNALNLINFQSNETSTSWPYLKFFYRPKKKDKSFRKFKEYINIVPTFCPLCGKKIKEDSNYENNNTM